MCIALLYALIDVTVTVVSEPSKEHEERKEEELAESAVQIIDREKRLKVRADEGGGEEIEEGSVDCVQLARGVYEQ